MEKLLVGEKVEWKKLGEVCQIKRGRVISKHYLEMHQGEYPVYSSQTRDDGKIGSIDTYDFDGDYVTWTTDGAYAGTIFYRSGKFSITNICGLIFPKNKNKLNLKFVFYWLQITTKKYVKDGSGNPKLMSNVMGSIKIPIPSLETQEKIVKILDNFTNYVTELQAELQAELQVRNKQYNYYRDMLLSEDYLNKISKKLDSLNYVLRLTTLGEIGKFTRGNGLQKKDFREKGKPVIHYGQIYTQYGFSTDKTISFAEENIFSKLRKAKPNDILIATTSENIEDVAKSTVWLGNEEVGFSGDMYSYSTNENSKYIAYYFQTAGFQKQKERKVTGTKLIRIHGEDMEKFTISLPPIEIQNKIVKILDRFQELLSDTKGLLPLEIEQRRKQYEYYREKLLTFDSICARTNERTLITKQYLRLIDEAAEVAGIDVSDKVEWKKLSEVAKYYDGTHQTPKYTESGVPFVSVQNIKDLYSTNKFISLEDFQKYKAKPEKNDIFMTRIGDVGTCALVKNNENLAYYVTLTLIKPNCKVVLSKFLKYFIESSYGKMELSKRILHNATPIKINLKDIGKIKLPLPPLPVQEYIVSILDEFDTLVNDLSQGLPKEIALRQKQYEYYREKLLDFEK